MELTLATFSTIILCERLNDFSILNPDSLNQPSHGAGRQLSLSATVMENPS